VSSFKSQSTSKFQFSFESSFESKPTMEPTEPTFGDLMKVLQDLSTQVESVEASLQRNENEIAHEGTPPCRRGYCNHNDHRDVRETKERILKVKIEAPTFDGHPDPWAFIDWLCQMEQFFDWYN